MRSVLWWGRFDPDYSRNRILRLLLSELGWQVQDFYPHFSALGDWEARLWTLPRPDLVWVPCFRQRDLAAAGRWARAKGLPLLFDPLISAYDKQVFERAKCLPDSPKARRLHAWERRLFQSADIVLADTQAHAAYFIAEFGLVPERVHIVYVGAEEPLFHPAPMPDHSDGHVPEVLFYGSFIDLQAPQVIVEAARLYQGPPVQWTLLGQGPLRAECERLAVGLPNVRFEDPIAYEKLPERIHRADILLGVFDDGAKAGRVIPNKVFQAMACGRPVLTRRADAYPAALRGEGRGLFWVTPASAEDLANKVARLVADAKTLASSGPLARAAYEAELSLTVVRDQLSRALPAPPSLAHA